MYFLICSIMFRSCKVCSKDAVMIKKIMFRSCIFYTCKKAYLLDFIALQILYLFHMDFY